MDKKIKTQEMGHFEKYMPLYIIYGISLGLSAPLIVKLISCYGYYCPDYKLLIISLILWISSVGILMLGINSKKYDKETRIAQNMIVWLIMITTSIGVVIGLSSSGYKDSLGVGSSIAILCMSYLLGKSYWNVLSFFYTAILLFASLLFYMEYTLGSSGFMNAIG